MLVCLVMLLWAVPSQADPVDEGPILYGLDPLLSTTRNPRFLGVERLILRERLRRQGVDPFKRLERPSLRTSARVWLERRMNVKLDPETVLIEPDGTTGLYTVLRYPEWYFLVPSPRPLPDGFTWQPPRRLDDPVVDVFVDDLDAARQRNLAVSTRLDVEDKLNDAGGGSGGPGDGLINFTIPIKLPRTLESIIGRGEKTQIRISGREHISIRGETTRSSNFVASEQVRSQSWFPDLDMEQQLQVKLDGQIGEKIFIEVEHDSEAIGSEGTKIRLAYRGDEDEIIQSIETGDVGLTIPGGQLLGYSTNQSGLFGIKVTGQLGPAAFTVVASKQKAESDSKAFNSSGGQQTDHEIYSHQYLNNRFFRLDLPAVWYGAPGEVLGYTIPDEVGRQADGTELIDRSSIRVYRSLGGVQPQPGDIQYVAAGIDKNGRWDAAYVDELTGDLGNWEYGWVWRPVDFSFLETVNGDLVAVDLGTTYSDDTILAVTYDVVNTAGGLVYKVGEQPEDGDEQGMVIDGVPYYRMKLLKPPQRDEFTFQYVMRNIYGLGGSNIDPESFEMSIQLATQSEQPGQAGATGYTFMNVFGLDVEQSTGVSGADGLVDKHRSVIFDLVNGLLKFPLDVPFPFNADESFYRANADSAYAEDGNYFWDFEETGLPANLTPEIYDHNTNPAQYDNYGTFKLVPSHASASSSFNLGASNIEEGSESVVLDGRTLTKGVDYEIDYLFGEVNLKGDAAASLTPDSNIQVNYQYSPFFGGGQSSLLGFNLAYDLGPESSMSTTWLYESNSIVGHKAKIGEEPSRNLVGNLNLAHTIRSSLLTDMANAVTIGSRERESTLQFRGEAAISVPDPNTRDKAYAEDFEGAESSDLVSLSRLGWYQASRPIDGDGLTQLAATDRMPSIHWYIPEIRVQRQFLNPELEGQERTETQQAIELYMEKDPEATWESGQWGGIMRGLSATGLDLSQSQFLELWVNDNKQTLDSRRGVLHIDFGTIDEDFAWPETEVDGVYEYDTWQLEDLNQDGNFNQTSEDVGLDAYVVTQDGRRVVVREGEVYNAEEADAGAPYPNINNTRGNTHEDSEDLDGNTRFDRDNDYYTVAIDLAETEPLIDVYDTFPTADLRGTAWRKYRIRLSDLDLPVGSPDIAAVRHIRIWYEDPESPDDNEPVRLQLSELQFLGSRWERQGIRKVGTEELLTVEDESLGEGFFIGEINNKDNANYAPPFPVREENGIPEKETSLILDVTDLQPDHMVRAMKQVSARGDDYTRYNKMSWYWHASDADAADLDVFFRLGADTLNYYEVSARMADMPDRYDWRKLEIELKYLTNIKNNEPDEFGVINGEIEDLKGDRSYDVRIVGRPDLTRVTRFFVGVKNTTRRPISGQIRYNDIILEGAKRDVGLAESVDLQLNLADVLKVDFDWDRRDADFHGLSEEAGQGAITENWGFSTSAKLEDYIPLLGFSVPVSFGRRMSTSRPKYEINSDVEILDDDRRNALSSVEDRNNYSIRLSHRQSRNPFLRYIIDPWNFSLSGSATSKDSPTVTSDATTMQGSVSYNVTIQGDNRLSDVPLLQKVPVVSGLAYLPSRLEGSFSFTDNWNKSTRRDTDGTVYPSTETQTKPGSLSGAVDMRPLTFVNAKFTNRSRRDLMRPYEVGGINIGEENEYQQTLQLSFTLPKATQMPQNKFYAPLRAAVRAMNKARPSLEYDGGYANQHDPGNRQEGDPEDIHSVGNSSSWRFSGRLPLGDLFTWLIPKPKRSDAERAALLAEQNRLQQLDEVELFDPSTIEGWDEMTADQQQEAEARWNLEQAELRLEEEARREGGRDEDQEQVGGRKLSLRGLIEPGVQVLRDFEPVQFTYSNQRSSGYGRLTGYDAPTAYRFGFSMHPDFPDSSYDVLRLEDSADISVSTSTRITRDMKFDVKYQLRESHSINRTTVTTETWNYSQNWPDVGLSLTGLEDWGLFGGNPADRDAGWFKSSSVNFNYKHTKDVSNYTRTFYEPRRSTALTPSWNMTFHSDLQLNLNGNWSRDKQINSGVLTTARRFRVGAQIKHDFRAQRLLAKLGLYRAGSTPTINMTVDLSYSHNTSLRESPGSVFEAEPTGNSIISVQPRFSYQINRSLSGAFTANFSRNKNIGEDTHTTTFGIGLEADFVF